MLGPGAGAGLNLLQFPHLAALHWVLAALLVLATTGTSAADFETTWKLTAEQIRLTAHLKTVVATPIRIEGSPGKLVGILWMDSPLSAHECCGKTSITGWTKMPGPSGSTERSSG